MGGGKGKCNKEMQALVAAALNDSNAQPNGEGMLNPNQPRQTVAPTFASQLVSGGSPLMSNAQGLTRPNTIQAAMPKPTDHKSPAKPKGRGSRNKHVSQPYDQAGPYREHEHYMPIANVSRTMRKVLPPHAKVADDAKETVQECVTEFISFVTSEANAHCKEEHRKTIMAEDIITALAKLGFDNYVEPLLMYLNKYRDSEMLPVLPKTNAENTPPLVQPTSNGLPPISMMHPHFAMMFGGPANGVYYPNAPIPSAGTQNNAPISAVGPAVPGSGGYYPNGPVPSAGTQHNAPVFAAAPVVPGNGGYNPNEPFPSAGTQNNGPVSAAAPAAVPGNDPGLSLGRGFLSGGDGGAGPSGSSSTSGMSLFDYLSEYK